MSKSVKIQTQYQHWQRDRWTDRFDINSIALCICHMLMHDKNLSMASLLATQQNLGLYSSLRAPKTATSMVAVPVALPLSTNKQEQQIYSSSFVENSFLSSGENLLISARFDEVLVKVQLSHFVETRCTRVCIIVEIL